MEGALHGSGNATVVAAVGGKPRGEAAWGRGTRRSGACGTEVTNDAARGKQLARYRRVLLPFQHNEQNDSAG